MSYKFPVRLNTTVHKAQLQEESSVDWRAIDEKNRREAEAKAAMESADALWAEQNRINKVKEQMAASVGADTLFKVKLSCLESLQKDVPDMCVSEAFAHLYIDSCKQILDDDYVLENLESFRSMAYMYIRKLGGMPYLKAQAESKNASPYLKKFYTACDEAAKKIVKNKSKEIMDAMSEDEARDILNGSVKVKDKNDLLDQVDTLGTDQLAELIRNKVVNVVRDEQLREKDEREQRTILKNDLISGEPIGDVDEGDDGDEDKKKDDDAADDVDFDDEGDDDKKSKKKGKKSKSKDDDDEDLDSDSDDKESKSKGKKGKDKEEDDSDDDDDKKSKSKKKGKKKDSESDDEDKDSDDMGDLEEPSEDEDSDSKGKKKSKKKKSAKESFFLGDIENFNPLTESFDYQHHLSPRSLFYAINVSVMKDMVESAATTEGASVTAVRRKAPEVVMENPLNMDIFMDYLKDNSDGYDAIEKAETHEPAVLGSSAPMVDYDKVLTESLVQYTLLECAHTIKLINVTPEMVRQQSDYLLGI